MKAILSECTKRLRSSLGENNTLSYPILEKSTLERIVKVNMANSLAPKWLQDPVRAPFFLWSARVPLGGILLLTETRSYHSSQGNQGWVGCTSPGPLTALSKSFTCSNKVIQAQVHCSHKCWMSFASYKCIKEEEDPRWQQCLWPLSGHYWLSHGSPVIAPHSDYKAT